MPGTYVLRKGKSRLADLRDGLGSVNSLMAAGGIWYYLDPTHGTEGGSGETLDDACSSIETLYAKLRDGYNDGIIFIGGATASNPAATITWSKSYAHLIGLSSNLPGLGQRCRIVFKAATAATVGITVSGSGCVFQNVQIYNEKAAGAAAGTVIVTGSRCEFSNVFFMVPVATDAASYSLKLEGSENVFYRCTIGQFTNVRTGASYNLWMTGAETNTRNKFIECEFFSWSSSANHVHVLIDVAITVETFMVWFENCLFQNLGTALTESINDNCTVAGHQVVLRGRDSGFLNVTAVGGTLTYIFALDADDAVSGQLMIAVAES